MSFPTRDEFARAALAEIPRILTLLDRNPHSPTYGCFDRNFWHYKIVDFPSGMSQEFVWPLALVYQLDLPDNPYYQQASIRNWVAAGILYAARSAHPDGSCDDYFPFERAGGATAFSLLACVESYTLLKLDNAEMRVFFEHRADWLAHHNESGQLTNHQALIVLCLELVGRLNRTSKWSRAKATRLDRVLEWQNSEGWFTEYEGCDPGYHSLTIWCLARLLDLHAIDDERLRPALIKAIELASQFVHPDGTYGGEYGSRNTYNFFPHGFELAGRWMPTALDLNDRFLIGLANGLAPCYSDDHIIGHHTWNYLLTWQDFVTDRHNPNERHLTHPIGRIHLPNAGLLIDRRAAFPDLPDANGNADLIEPSPHRPGEASVELYIALNKGGTFKLFRDGQLLASDTQVSLRVETGGKLRNAVGHLVDAYETEISDREITIRGKLGWAKQTQMTPPKLIVLRVVMLTVGRFFPNLIRKTLQKMLIVGKDPTPYTFVRRFTWDNHHWTIEDTIAAPTWSNIQAADIGGDRTSIYVVMSRTFQRHQLQPPTDLTDSIRQLRDGQPLTVTRQF
ncbi:MAG: hypothetical protein HC795_01135 [Coleofasciculaceae cyanobacterium RL_1_1]|nr:hypothetical protein [Coleofasciculaceae cyanobacterium RL_1_1]